MRIRAMEMAITMELHEPGRIGEEEILTRHIRLAEVLEGKRPLDWFDLVHVQATFWGMTR